MKEAILSFMALRLALLVAAHLIAAWGFIGCAPVRWDPTHARLILWQDGGAR